MQAKVFDAWNIKSTSAVPTDCFLFHLVLFFFFSFRKQQGSSAYLIEVGGSSYMGMFGYLTAFEEMMNQVKQVV